MTDWERMERATDCAREAAEYVEEAELQEAVRSLSEGLYHLAVIAAQGIEARQGGNGEAGAIEDESPVG